MKQYNKIFTDRKMSIHVFGKTFKARIFLGNPP